MPLGVALFVSALVAALVLGPNGTVYWDGYTYLSQSLDGSVGGLLLGRPLFVYVSHVFAMLWQGAGGSVWHLEPALRLFWMSVSAAAPLGVHALARGVGLSDRAALIAAVSLAFSPAFAHTANAVLTDGPAVTATVFAYVVALRATSPDATNVGLRAFGAGALLGVAVGLREQSILHVVGLALLLPRSEKESRLFVGSAMLAGLVLVAVAPVMYAVWKQPGYTQGVWAWFAAMKRERAQHPWEWRNLMWFAAWVLTLGPFAMLAATWCWVRPTTGLLRPGNALFAVCVPSLVQLVALAAYQDISFSPRYLLGSVVGAMCIPAAIVMDRWLEDEGTARRRGWVLVLLLGAPLLLGAAVVRPKQQALLRVLRETPSRLAGVPANAMVVTGQACSSVDWYMAQLRATKHGVYWAKICAGWSWPDALETTLDKELQERPMLVLDLRDGAWIGVRQRGLLQQLQRYAEGHQSAERLMVWR